MQTVNLALLTISLVCTLALCAVVAAQYGSNSNDKQDYFLANRALGWLPLSLTLIATQVGAGLLLGTSEEAFHHGLVGLFYSMGIGLGFLLLGFGIAGRLQALQLHTTAELFEKRYKSKTLRRFASVLSVLSLGGIFTGQIVASYNILAPIAQDWTIWLLAGLWITLIVYTWFGGLKAVIATDMLQVGIIVLVLFATLFLVLFFHDAQLPQHAWFSTRQGEQAQVPWSSWQSVLLMPACYCLIEQDLAQRFFASKNKRTAAWSALTAAVAVVLLALIPAVFGLLARQLVVHSQQPSAHPLMLLMDSLQSPLLSCLMLCALLAAISSTADSLLCAIASNIIYDFEAGDDSAKLSRWVTGLVGLSGLVLAPFASGILEVLTLSYTLSVSCLFVPLMACLLNITVYRQAAWVSTLAGLIGFIVAFANKQPNMPIAPLPCLALSLAGYVITHLLQPYFKKIPVAKETNAQ